MAPKKKMKLMEPPGGAAKGVVLDDVEYEDGAGNAMKGSVYFAAGPHGMFEFDSSLPHGPRLHALLVEHGWKEKPHPDPDGVWTDGSLGKKDP